MRQKIDSLIAEATKNKNREKLEVLRLIKSELLKAEKSGEQFDDIKILLKMVDQRKESIRQYIAAGRNDLVEAEEKEIKIISEYIPAQPTEEEVREYTKTILSAAGRTLTMRDMKEILSEVQKKYPMASGKIVSDELKKFIA